MKHRDNTYYNTTVDKIMRTVETTRRSADDLRFEHVSSRLVVNANYE